MRREFRWICFGLIVFYSLSARFFPLALWSLLLTGPIFLIGLRDYFQIRHTIRRNFPVVGNFRYVLEMIRPEINQYFIESNSDGRPFSREVRSIVYQRAKKERDTLPFGTQKDVYEVGYEWVNHSIMPEEVHAASLRIKIGGPDCTQPYSASIFNVSGMSYGALSSRAVEALNLGAKIGDFYQSTGEGSVTPYHLKHGGAVVWQIGTGYFGCRNPDGTFNHGKFTEKALHPNIKMIEVKLSQGAKPGHGGILPKAKLTKEISEIRGVPMGEDVLSPPGHTAFKTPIEFMKFLAELRKHSGGKPIGFKLCLGKRREFISICKAMIKTGITPDFITIDGGEGGTGAAPLEFANSVGCPLKEALVFIHNCLIGFGVRDRIKVIVSGKITTGFDVISKIALGADACNSARGMMLALGCIQALRCNSNTCPVGIATHDKELVAGLDIENKGQRVANFQSETLKVVAEMMGAMAVKATADLRPWHLMRRTDQNEIKHYGEIYEYLGTGDLMHEPLPSTYARAVRAASAETFHAIEETAAPLSRESVA